MVNKQMRDDEHSWDFLSDREATFVDKIIRNLTNIAWAQPLLTAIERNGGVIRANKARFFELRFAYALHQAGIAPSYEVPGEGQSALGFGFTCAGNNWLVELMRLEDTQTVEDATQPSADEDGTPWFLPCLSTNAEALMPSIEGETLMAVQRICQTCERDGQPHKFPALNDSYRAILVDFRTFVDGGDIYDRIHVGLGGEYVRDWDCRLYSDGILISGVFNERTSARGAVHMRERVHFLGFVRETAFADGAFSAGTQFIANPYIFSTVTDVQAAIAAWPLQPVTVLNGE